MLSVSFEASLLFIFEEESEREVMYEELHPHQLYQCGKNLHLNKSFLLLMGGLTIMVSLCFQLQSTKGVMGQHE